nr:AIF_HP1_G0030800.mRNA.1.CDS.1 [Saccharomyces cerevisiae]
MESRLALESLMESDLDDSYLLGILQQTRRNIGRTALVLSGGGTFGLFHIGVLGTLFELDLLPRGIIRMGHIRAGAIVASILSVHHKEEIPVLLNHILDKEFNIFKDDKQKSESENLLIKISRFFKNGTWFDNKHLVNTMIEFLGDLTFREAYNRTGKILNITVSPASLFEQPRLLNNLTAPNVLIWSAKLEVRWELPEPGAYNAEFGMVVFKIIVVTSLIFQEAVNLYVFANDITFRICSFGPTQEDEFFIKGIH